MASYTSELLARIYIREIVHLHGVPVSIISDCGTQFTLHFWSTVQRELGMKVEFSTALYGSQCRSPVGWFDPGEAILLGTNLVRDALEKVKLIQEGLRTTQYKKKRYADQKVLDVAFMEGEKVLLRVSPMKEVMMLGKRGKWSPWFTSPFEVLEKVGKVAYRLALPPILSGVHPVLHISMLSKYHEDKSHLLDLNTVQLDENLAYEEEPVAILDRQVRKLRSKVIASIKVQWRCQPVDEADKCGF
ncbi:uncharacterized protein [Nicotiana tomentosiformis]|uniref:uncharacterized protein n=1 Tax=Nicotiana tomentosiformis TaxID=4098 RepID=UPI00388C7B1B